MKKIVISLVLCLALLASCVGVAEGKFTAGTYTGTAKGFGGDVNVTVELSADAIVNVTAEGAAETAGIGSIALEQLPQTIAAAQTLAVDTIAGCTVTSQAVLAAAEQAMRAAGAADDVIFAEAAAVEAAADEVIDTNVVIIGAGAAGLSAALRASQNGVEDVLVIEKMPIVGGATSTAGGGMQAYNKDADPDVEQANKEELFLYWSRTGKFTNNARLTMMAVDLSTPTIEWMNASGVPTTGGPVEGKPTVSYSCEGRAAGAINNLYAEVQKAGVPVMLQTKAEHLIEKDGRVVSVIATGANGQKITINANAVLLATGGYGNNMDLVTDEDVRTRSIYYGPVCATGDGHMMAKELGIPLFNMDKVATKHFGIETQPGFGIHIHWAVAQLFTKTGAIAVNKAGERVVDESGDELDIALASMYKSEDGRLYMIMDQEDYDLYKSILLQYNAFTEEELDQFIAENGAGITKLVRADTIEAAAEAIGLDGAAVKATVDAYNANVEAGGKDPFKRPFTDKIGEGPYYIQQTVARFATTLGGVNVNDNLQVLDVNEKPIEGLYAAGEMVGNINGSYAHYLIWCFGSGMHFGDVIAK